MTTFDGHMRDLGPMPGPILDALIARVLASEDLWRAELGRFTTEVPAMDHVIFRFPDAYPESHVPASYRPIWRGWAHLVTPLIETCTAALGFRRFDSSKIMLSRLKSGGSIPRHTDENLSSAVPHKIHVPLVTDPRVWFHVDSTPYHLEVGRAYELNNHLPHDVQNNSDIARVHLIFDCFPVEANQ